MENFLNFIRKSHLLVGFDFDLKFIDNWKISWILTFIKYSNLTILIIGLIQMLLYLIIEGLSGQMFIDTIYLMILTIHGITKILIEMVYLEKMKIFISRIDEVYKTNFGGYLTKDGQKYSKFAARTWSGLFVFAVLMTVMQFAVKFVKYLIQSPTNIRNPEAFLFGCYFPFDSYNYVPWILIYMFIVYLRAISTCLFSDHIAIFKIIMLTNCFERLAEDLKEVIDGHKRREFSDTGKMLKNIVDVHNKLIEFCAELNEFYKYLFGLSALTDTFILATIGYMCIVRFILNFLTQRHVNFI